MITDVHALALLGSTDAMSGRGVGSRQRHIPARSDAILVDIFHIASNGPSSVLRSRVWIKERRRGSVDREIASKYVMVER